MSVLEPIRTSDLYLAAYLQVAEVPLLGVERDDTKRVVFVFDGRDPAVVRQLKRQYFSGASKVSALGFVQAIRSLKALLHSQGGGDLPSGG